MTIIRTAGCDLRIMTTELDRDRIEAASESELVRLIEYAEFELEIAENKHADDIAEDIREVLKQLRVQQRLNAEKASRENGLICGMI